MRERNVALLAPTPKCEETSKAQSPSGGSCGEDDGAKVDDSIVSKQELDHSAAITRELAELLECGTRVLCRSMHSQYRHLRRNHSLPILTFVRGFAAWVDREAGRTRAGKTARPGVDWRRLQRDMHRIWHSCGCQGVRPSPHCARLNERLVLSVVMLSFGVSCGSRRSGKTSASERGGRRTKLSRTLCMRSSFCPRWESTPTLWASWEPPSTRATLQVP